LRAAAEWSRHTEEVIASLRSLVAHATEAESAQRGYAITGNESYPAFYQLAREAADADILSLRRLTADNAAQQRRLDAVEPLVAGRMTGIDEEITARRSQGFAAAQAATLAGLGKQFPERIRGSAAEMETAEQDLLRQRNLETKRRGGQAKATIVAGSLLALVTMVVALFAARRNFARRRRSLAQAALAARLARLGAWEVALPGFRVTWSYEIYVIHEVSPGFDPTLGDGINFYAPESRGIIREAIEACTRDGTPFDLELQLITAKGRWIWVRAIGEAERDRKGVIRRIQGATQDISQRKQGEAKVRESEARYRSLFEHAPDGIVIADPEGTYLDANASICRMLGYTRDELIGLDAADIVVPEETTHIGPALSAIKAKADYHRDWRFRRKNGSVLDTEVTGNLMPDGNVLGMIRDITGRKQAEETLRLLNSAVLQSKESILITDAQLDPPGPRIVFVNPAFTRMTGYGAEEVIGQSPRILQGPRTDRAVLDRLRGNLERGEVFEGEAINYRKDGKAFYLEWQVAPLRDPGGKITHFVAIQRDVTQRKQSEEALHESETQFRQVVENIDEVFWVMDAATNVMLYVSPAFAEIWGRSCESLHADQRTWLESVHPVDRERVGQARAAKYTRGDYDETFRIVRPDGAIRWIHSRASPVHDQAGAVHRVVGICEDITKYRTMEEQFRQAQKLEAIGTLAGGIAHDFNNILAAINGYTELSLLTLKENPEVRESLAAVLKASGRAADLIRQILMFSRQQPLERRPIRLHSIVAECIALLRATLPATIEFDTSLATDAPAVLADATQIHQILMNLGTNAWHAMKEHPGRLQVRLERCAVDAAYASTHPQLRVGVYTRISVSDTGSGMDSARLRRIFEPFYTTKPIGEGTGLGLAVVHGIMDSHDGVITVYSQPGEGTVFHLYFPAYGGEAVVPTIAAEEIPRGQGERVLFVDDEELLARLGQKTLAALGYEAEFTTQPAAALDLVRADPSRFVLVLTDQTMPEMTGLTLATQLREIRPGLPIILTTGYSLSLTPARLAAAGIHQLLLKPTTLHSLAMAVHAALHPPVPSQ
jgi:PAS domain S-box-containing protein